MKYKVYAYGYYTTKCIEVESRNENEAIDEFCKQIGPPSVCHYCSSEVEIGDIDDFEVEAVSDGQ